MLPDVRQFVHSLLGTISQQQQLLQTFLSTARHRPAAAAVDGHGDVTTEHRDDDHKQVLLQLVHAETGEKSPHVYSLNTALLIRLFECSGHRGSNVLLNMLKTPAGFASAIQHDAALNTSTAKQRAASIAQLLRYDGKHSTKYLFYFRYC